MTTTTAPLDDVLSEGDVVMLATADDQSTTRPPLSARPLTCVEIEGDAATFLVSSDADWVGSLESAGGDGQVVLTRDHGGRYVALSGRASLSADSARVSGYWNRVSEAYFDGPEDPRVRILDVQVDGGEWWEAPTSGLGTLMSMVGTVVLGRPTPQGDHGEIG